MKSSLNDERAPSQITVVSTLSCSQHDDGVPPPHQAFNPIIVNAQLLMEFTTICKQLNGQGHACCIQHRPHFQRGIRFFYCEFDWKAGRHCIVYNVCTLYEHEIPWSFSIQEIQCFPLFVHQERGEEKRHGGKSKATTCFQAKIIYLLLKIYGYLNTILSEDLFFGFNFVLLLVCFYHPSVSIQRGRSRSLSILFIPCIALLC